MDWQPIETAPKDGTVFIAGYGGGEYLSYTYEAYTVPCRGHEWLENVSWYDLSDCDRDGDYSSPYPPFTHWMPLPSPPEPTK